MTKEHINVKKFNYRSGIILHINYEKEIKNNLAEASTEKFIYLRS